MASAPDTRPISRVEFEQLKRQLREAQQTITSMQAVGGFADSKSLGIRSQRLEDRTAILEADVEMLLDANAMLLGALREHLIDRHNVDSVRDNDRDVINVRRALRRMSEWADKRGLRDKQREVIDAHRDENRLRPRQVSPPPVPTAVNKGGVPSPH